MIRIAITIALLTLVVRDCGADEIYLRNGRKMTGTVLEYKDGFIKVRTDKGEIVSGEISKVNRISFKRQAAAAPGMSDRRTTLIEKQVEAKIRQAKMQSANSPRATAIVGMYIDTEDPNDIVPEQIEYKCYSVPGGGYSGVVRVPSRQPWTRLESVLEGGSGNRRIELDPGPPYETVRIPVVLEKGKPTNLGRIVLKKVKGEGTVSVVGTVTDSDGNPMPDVMVSAGKQRTQTDGEGRYRLDGFGLEVLGIKAIKRGYFGGYYGRDVQVSIRNYDKREIKQDLTLYQPHRLRLSYVVSKPNTNSFEGHGVEQGSLELDVDSTWVDFRRSIDAGKMEVSSASFLQFIRDVHLQLIFEDGNLKLRHFMAPIFYQQASPDATFDSITECARLNRQRCPPLKEGAIILVRGYQDDPSKGRSPYCVKILVEELSVRAD